MTKTARSGVLLASVFIVPYPRQLQRAGLGFLNYCDGTAMQTRVIASYIHKILQSPMLRPR